MKIDINVVTVTFDPKQIGEKAIELLHRNNFRVKLDTDIIPMLQYAKQGYETIIFSDIYLNFIDPQDAEVEILIEGKDRRERTLLLGSVTGKLNKPSGGWWVLLNPTYTERIRRIRWNKK